MRLLSAKNIFLCFAITSCTNEVSETEMFARAKTPQVFNYIKNNIIPQDKTKDNLFIASTTKNLIDRSINDFSSRLLPNKFLKYSFSTHKNSDAEDNNKVDKEKSTSYSEFVRVLIQNREGKYLVLRTKYGDNYFWLFPGGKVEKGESLSNAAEREVLEETGLIISDCKYLGEFISPRLYKGISWKGYVYLTSTNATELINPEPNICSEIAFKSYDELLPLVVAEDSYVTELILRQFASKL